MKRTKSMLIERKLVFIRYEDLAKIIIGIANKWTSIDLLFILLVIGCGPGRSDFAIKLSGDYFLIGANVKDVFVSPIVFDSETPIIPATVNGIYWEGNIICATRNNSISGRLEYWVLDTSVPCVFGPLSKEQSHEQLSKYGIKGEPIYSDINEIRRKEFKKR